MHPHILHSYGTRIRKNSVLKPSARLRQTPPPPRRIRPVPSPAPHRPAPLTPDPCFPIPGVMLHPEDASNKVLHAIGRAFLSVENRAMTIKDLAEMTLKHGLMCQSVSAASQAITTYIRNHMARCETQQDHPLLLRHVLSGTLADDDLLPALHSRVGGAANLTKSGSKELGIPDKNVAQVIQGPPEAERVTNFRRGTMVWYLSKAAGVSCPFARSGIRLCDYGKGGRKLAEYSDDRSQPVLKKHPNHDEARCGEKRKRLRRGCRRDSDVSLQGSSAGRDSWSPAIDSGYGELSTESSDDERPPKVKLTLRLRPSLPCAPTPAAESRSGEVIDLSNGMTPSSSEDDDAGADAADDINKQPDPLETPWSLPPYPRRSIPVPCYTPISDERMPSASLPDQERVTVEERKRSPSVPWSASPPPDSDHDDFDLDSDIDRDSSPCSVPSPAVALQVKVEIPDDLEPFRHEPADIRGMLDAWEDLDRAPTSTLSSKLPTTEDLKGTLDLWDWEFESGWNGTLDDQHDFPIIKMEPDEYEPLVSFGAFAPASPASPHSPFTPSYHSSSAPTSELSVGPLTFRARLSPSSPASLHSPSSSPIEIRRGGCSLTWQDAELLGPDTVHPHEFDDGWASGVRAHADSSAFSKCASDEVAAFVLSVEPKEELGCALLKEAGSCHTESRAHQSSTSSSTVEVPGIVVVHTHHPCSPDVLATQIEGISVYQTVLGRAVLLRRIDTDFVNLSTILSHQSLPLPSPLPSGCVHVSHPSLSIDGIWAPLSVARLYASGLPPGLGSTFLSDDLVMHFPTALQDFHQKSTSGRLLNQFGPHFNSSHSWSGAGNPLHVPQPDLGKSAKETVWEASVEAGHVEDPLLAILPSVNDALAALHPPTLTEEVTALPETPLSPTEQEIFHVLCVHPDWESDEAGDEGRAFTAPKHNLPRERPLRRSKRVADAVTARSRVAPPCTKGPRNS